jgi:hypothetical protein
VGSSEAYGTPASVEDNLSPDGELGHGKKLTLFLVAAGEKLKITVLLAVWLGGYG